MIVLLVDRKVTTWLRTVVEVDAGNYKEAIAKYNDASLVGCKFISAQELAGVRQPIDVKENNHLPTVEIYSPDRPGELWNNKNGYK